MSCSRPAAPGCSAARRWAGSCSGATSSSSSSRRSATSSASHQGKEYAEPEWPLDLWLTIVWVAFCIVFFGTILKREEPHIYVANWFYLAFIITIAMLHIVNNLALPVSAARPRATRLRGRPGRVDPVVVRPQRGRLLPDRRLPRHDVLLHPEGGGAAGLLSYRLSIVHFWTLIFIYIWAGPHHLHYTALPDWAQTLGMVFSVMLWMPSWGGMINGLMTLSGAWDKLRTDPVAALLGHRRRLLRHGDLRGADDVDQDRQRAHRTTPTGPSATCTRGALGWVGFITFGALYYLVPRLWKRSRPLLACGWSTWHFWVATLGIVLYITVDVGRRHHAGPDVARLRRARLPAVLASSRPSRRCTPTT